MKACPKSRARACAAHRPPSATERGGGQPSVQPASGAGEPRLLEAPNAELERRGLDARHRYYLVEDGNHVDGLYATFPDRLRPLLPCARAGFTAMVRWVGRSLAVRAVPSEFPSIRSGMIGTRS